MSPLFKPLQFAEIDWLNPLSFSQEKDLEHSLHVFIKGNDLIQRWEHLPSDDGKVFHIAEAGFGWGLNFLLTWKLWEQHAPSCAHLHYISCENHPLKLDDLKKISSFWPELKDQAQHLIDNYPVLTPGYHQLTFKDHRVSLTLMLGDALECYEQLLHCGDSNLESEISTVFVDAWYLDGFSTHQNVASLLEVFALLSKEGTTLVTDTDSDAVKSVLNDTGFLVEMASKTPMITACFNKPLLYKKRTSHTPWHIAKSTTTPDKSAIIIGAGLAGSFLAHSLARRDWKVTLVDELGAVGQGGSANQQAVLFPKLSPYKSPLNQFMLSAFIYANKWYQKLLALHPIGALRGSLLLAHNEREIKAQLILKDWLLHYPELGELVDEPRVSQLTGLALKYTGLFIPLSGWMNAQALCQILINHEKIIVLTDYKVESLNFDEGQWHIGKLKAPVLILSNGPKVNLFNQTKHLPVQAVRGQMTAIAANQKTTYLKVPLCGEAHVLPELNGMHWLGATYDQGTLSPDLYSKDDEINRSKLTDEIPWSQQVLDHWAGIRAATPDYLPLIGPAPMAEAFIHQFAPLKTDAKRWIAKVGAYYPGLYLCAGFGSRGLTTIPLGAEWLAAHLNNEISCLPRNLIQALSPARFLIKNITRGI